MLPKKNRVSKKEVDLVFKQGRFLVSPNLTFKYLRPTGLTCGNSHRSDLWVNYPKISFIVSKSTAKLAVKRNFLRRRGYSILAKYISQFPTGIVGVFVFKKYQDDISIIENEIKIILAKLN